MKRDGLASGMLLWTRSEVRRRWPALVLLGVLAGLSSGLALAAFDGATRTESAYRRMRVEQAAADVVFFPSQAFAGDLDVTLLETIPEVESWGGFAATESQFDEFPGIGGPLVMVGDDWLRTIERARVIAGRLPDPDADDEVVINETLADSGVVVGDEVTWRNLSPADAAEVNGYPPPDWDWSQTTGPLTRLRVVGVVRQPMESVVSFAAGESIWVGPGWAARHLDEAAVSFVNAFVKLRGGYADVAAFEAGVARVYGRDDLPVKNLRDDSKRIQRSLDVERTSLMLFAAAVAVATIVLVGQTMIRSVRAGSDALVAMRALGVDRTNLVVGLTAPHLLTLAVLIVVGGAATVLLSARFPIGLGRQIDPNLGAHAPILVMLVGLAVAALVMAALCAMTAWRMVRSIGPRPSSVRARVVGAATRAGVSVPVAVGASMALESPPSRAGSARSALAAAVLGVAGVVSALTLVAGIDDALREPERVGQWWDLEASPLVEPDALPAALEAGEAAVTSTPGIESAGLMTRWATTVGGKGDVPVYALHDIRGSSEFTLLRGRAPHTDGEVAIGPSTAGLLGVSIGDTITVGVDDRPMIVVGVALLAQTPHTSFDEGAWVAPTVFDAVSGTTLGMRELGYLVRVADDASATEVSASLTATGLYVETPLQPPDVANLDNVRNLPLYLAAFLVLLALGAIGHGLLTAARSRARDLAVLRAIGLRPGQTGACVTWQAAVIGLVALALGVPIGIVVGRQLWRRLADSLSFVYVGPLLGIGIVVVAVAALIATALLAVVPARGATRLRASEILRAG